MKILKTSLFIGVAVSLLFGSPTPKKDQELKSVVKMGERGAKLLIKTLQTEMKKSLTNDGLLKTFDFCSNRAYSLTQKVNKKLPKGVRVKRISQKFRSPANAPQEHEAYILKTFQVMKELHIVHPNYLVEQVNTHTYKYYKPLIINKKVCLKCHGNIKNTDIKQAIKAKYPLDNAIKYKMGDLRGAIVVTIDKSVK